MFCVLKLVLVVSCSMVYVCRLEICDANDSSRAGMKLNSLGVLRITLVGTVFTAWLDTVIMASQRVSKTPITSNITSLTSLFKGLFRGSVDVSSRPSCLAGIV